MKKKLVVRKDLNSCSQGFKPVFLPAFSGMCSNFDNFLSSVYKFGMVYTLVYRCFRICLDWVELTFFKRIFRKKSYPENLIVVLKSF